MKRVAKGGDSELLPFAKLISSHREFLVFSFSKPGSYGLIFLEHLP